MAPCCHWQAEADTELTLSASPTTAVGQKALALAKRRYSTVMDMDMCSCVVSSARIKSACNGMPLATRWTLDMP